MEPSNRTGRRGRGRSGILDTVQDTGIVRSFCPLATAPDSLHTFAGEGSDSHSCRGRGGRPGEPLPSPPCRRGVHIRQSHLYSARTRRPRGTSQSTVVNELSRFKLLSVDSLHNEVESSDSSSVDSDEEDNGGLGNPFLLDGFGNRTKWRLSDLNAEFDNYLEEQANKPKEKKSTKEERLKTHSDRMERYMRSALQKYNIEEKISEDMYFRFDEVQTQSWIVEGEYDNQFYYHFNFAATQDRSRTCMFFAEVTPEFDIVCCKLLGDDDNGHCYGCKNARAEGLRHPACSSVYVGGHEDRKFPFMIDSESEDDSD